VTMVWLRFIMHVYRTDSTSARTSSNSSFL